MSGREEETDRVFRWMLVGALVVSLLVLASKCGTGCAEKSCDPVPVVTVP